jgi:hypothetical protein
MHNPEPLKQPESTQKNAEYPDDQDDRFHDVALHCERFTNSQRDFAGEVP